MFTRILDGEIPGRFVWSDPTCAVFLTTSPVTTGHALVVPREPIDHWIDAPGELLNHLMFVARETGAAQLAAFGGKRAGLVIQGYGVPHLHLHVFPSSGPQDFESIDGTPAPEAELDVAARKLRSALAAAGHHAPVAESLTASAR